MATLNKIEGLVVGQYGTAVELQVVDSDGNAEPIDSYTGITVVLRSQDWKTSLEFTGAFSTDGTDGKLVFTPTSGNTFDRSGTWNGQVEFTATSILAMTVPFEAEVAPKIGS
jgi:hypothetical protein